MYFLYRFVVRAGGWVKPPAIFLESGVDDSHQGREVLRCCLSQ